MIINSAQNLVSAKANTSGLSVSVNRVLKKTTQLGAS
jgi:hypothetical protein